MDNTKRESRFSDGRTTRWYASNSRDESYFSLAIPVGLSVVMDDNQEDQNTVFENASRSPIMIRIAGSGRLTLDLLRYEVPLLRDGQAAAETLAAGARDRSERVALMAVRSRGEAAKERLMVAAIPLIKHLAQKEHARRQNWQSQITFDDLFQEGMIGFMLGLARYDPSGVQTSPTNYLGQWISTTMRRNAEGVDNDFGVAYDAAERFRRIRALRSRLRNELGRDPVDSEMVDAWSDRTYVGNSKIGRVVKSATTSPPKALTYAQLDEERHLRARVGYTSRLSSGGNEEHDGPLVDFARPLTEQVGFSDAADVVTDRGVKTAIASVLYRTLTMMDLPPVQREVIARRYGLPPYANEESAREISRILNLHRDRVGRFIDAFVGEMSRPGGAFHKVCSEIDSSELSDIGMDWVIVSLGEYNSIGESVRCQELPSILTTTLQLRKAVTAVPREVSRSRATGVRAQFFCEYHTSDFVGMYANAKQVPQERTCPRCQRPARLIRLMPE